MGQSAPSACVHVWKKGAWQRGGGTTRCALRRALKHQEKVPAFKGTLRGCDTPCRWHKWLFEIVFLKHQGGWAHSKNTWIIREEPSLPSQRCPGRVRIGYQWPLGSCL